MTYHTLVENWSALTLSVNDSFLAALNLSTTCGYQLALVIKADGKLVGMVTDSDIRKALLKGVNLDDSVCKVMNSSPVVVSPNTNQMEAFQLMLLNHFFHLPIVNSDGILVGLHVVPQLQASQVISEPLVIMAGGLGKRLMPLTKNVPKPMLRINEKPILQHIIESARFEGFTNIVISVNYLAEQIIDFFGNGSAFDLNIDYLHENNPLGTAGALANLPTKFTDQNVVVTNADLISKARFNDLLRYLKDELCEGVMAVRTMELKNPFGVVLTKGNELLGLDEKPTYRHQVNAGMYVLSPAIRKLLVPDSYCDMTDLFTRALHAGLNLVYSPCMKTGWILVDLKNIKQLAG